MSEDNGNIIKLNKVSSDIEEIWGDFQIYDLRNIKSNWNDSACEDYVEKFKKLDNTINSILREVDNLKNILTTKKQDNDLIVNDDKKVIVEKL